MLLGGIDIGGTKVAVGVAGPDGRLVASERFATRPERGPEAVLDEAARSLRGLAEREGGGLAAVGVGSVGPLDLATGTILSPPNFPGWQAVPLRAMLTQRLGVPVTVDNDANAAALAEYRFGAGRGASVMVYVTLSTGVGGGLVVGDRLLHGLGGGAGELGHQTIVADGPLCGCGNRGCLEALVSGTAIARRARDAATGDAGRALLAIAGGESAGLNAQHVIELARAGDPLATRLWEDTLDWLAMGLGNVVTILAPDRLVVGGGVAAGAGSALLAPLLARMARRVKLVPVERLDLRLAAFGPEAGLVGAIAVARPGPTQA